MEHKFYLLSIAFVTASMVACKDSALNEMKVTAGIETSPDQYRSVVKLVRKEGDLEVVCTGTYISKSLVLTAAHCLASTDSPNSLYMERLNETEPRLIKALATSQHPLYNSAAKISPHDVAVIEFETDEETVTELELRSDHVQAGEKVTLVGFGDNSNFYSNGVLTGSGSGLKRIGTNKVYAVMPNAIIILSGVDGTESTESSLGVDVVSGNGDSGSPLITENSLVGIAVGGALIKHPQTNSMRAISYFVDLTRKENADFVNSNLEKKM